MKTVTNGTWRDENLIFATTIGWTGFTVGLRICASEAMKMIRVQPERKKTEKQKPGAPWDDSQASRPRVTAILERRETGARAEDVLKKS